jgi:hypothetical protein
MSQRFGRKTEAQVSRAVLSVLASLEGGEATIRQLKERLPDVLELSDEDRTPSLTRPGEELWEQQVRNIVSHRDSSGNFIHDGLLDYSPRRLAITLVGREMLR